MVSLFLQISEDLLLFLQAREVRNKILHSADIKMTDQELQDSITVLDNMLSDSKTLAANLDAKQAKIMLAKVSIVVCQNLDM